MKVRLEHLPADTLGLSPTARAALAAGDAFPLVPVPRRASSIPRPLERLDPDQRELLVRRLRAGLEQIDVPERVRTSLNVLATGNVFAVVSGQQPGFLCSPLYCLYKAMQACRIAHELTLEWGLPVVPLFWNHADDHDVAEVHHTHFLNRNLDVQKLGLAGMSSGRVPVSRIVLEEERHRLSATRAVLAQTFGDWPFTEAALELFFPRAGESLARAFTRTLTELLGEHGLVVVEPDWIRELGSLALARIVGQSPAGPLAAGEAEVTSVELSPAIESATAALVYRVDENGRHALRIGGDGFRYDGEAGSRTPAELAAEILQDPGGWSAGALLRPLVQDMVLPTAAYVGGWGELAYHGQLGPLREAVGLPRTPFVPRISATLVDADTRQSLERLDTDVETVLRAEGAFEPTGDDGAHPAVIDELRQCTERMKTELLEHREALGEIDRALAVNLKRAADQAAKLVEKVLTKAVRVHENKSGKGRRHVRRVNNSLRPNGSPQERVLGPFATTARFGRAWIDALYEELPACSSEHVVAHLEGDTEEGSA